MQKKIFLAVIVVVSPIFLLSCEQDPYAHLGVEDANAAVNVMACIHSEYVDNSSTRIVNNCEHDVNVLIAGNDIDAYIATKSSEVLNSVGATGFVACRVPFKPKLITNQEFYCSYRSGH